MNYLKINFLPENVPSKKNSKQMFYNRKTGRWFPTSSENFKAWDKNNLLFLKSQYHESTIEKCLKIDLHITFYTKHRKDLTNVAEGLMDCMVNAGILIDDHWQVTGEVHLYPHTEGNSFAEIFYN